MNPTNKLLLSLWAGCSVAANVAAAELDISALFKTPEKDSQTIELNNDSRVNEVLSSNIDKAKRKQLKFLANTLFSGGSGNHALDKAVGYCGMVEQKDAQSSCKAGIALAQNDIYKAQGWCGVINDKDSARGCRVGIDLAKGNLNMAKGRCWQLKSQDGKNGCLAGTELYSERTATAAGYCLSIKDKDSRSSCNAGVELAKSNITSALGWCGIIAEKNAKYGCLSDVYLVSYLLGDDYDYGDGYGGGYNNYQPADSNTAHELVELKQEIEQIETTLQADIDEAKVFLELIETMPELLEDPQIRQQYNQLSEII